MKTNFFNPFQSNVLFQWHTLMALNLRENVALKTHYFSIPQDLLILLVSPTNRLIKKLLHHTKNEFVF